LYPIETTFNITRKEAISRIKESSNAFRQRKFQTLSKQTEDITPEEFYFDNQKKIDSYYVMFDAETFEYSNKFLEDIIDLPFYRISKFENYTVINDEKVEVVEEIDIYCNNCGEQLSFIQNI
jgi:hypothetical protein